MTKMVNQISKVIENDFCIGCGGCSYKNVHVEIKNNEYGMKVPNLKENTTLNDDHCPFATSQNETVIGNELYGNKKYKFEQRIGHFDNLFAGKVSGDSARIKSSSGGLTTWLLEQLMQKGEIDGVIHVGESPCSDELFEYTVSETIEDLKSRGKSRYYPANFDKALEKIDFSKKYAFVGIPCYIKTARLLCRTNNELDNSLKYFIGIFCGHLKSTKFASYLGWQLNVTPNKLRNIDFRVKNSSGLASNYSISATDNNGVDKSKLNKNLDGTDWGMGYFKPKACEFCDDISAETADIVFGDAWLPEYNQDNLGTNIVISRNSLFSEMLRTAAFKGDVKLDDLTIDKIIQSQAANYRHRHEGLSIRIQELDKNKTWHPKKRVEAHDYEVSKNRKAIYLLRMKMSEKSHTAFQTAEKQHSLLVFFILMLPLELKYYFLNKKFIRKTAKSLIVKFNVLFNKGAK